jgi:hypothetical protein
VSKRALCPAGIRAVPIDTWLQVIPQLIARIHTPSVPVRRLIHELLTEIGAYMPIEHDAPPKGSVVDVLSPRLWATPDSAAFGRQPLVNHIRPVLSSHCFVYRARRQAAPTVAHLPADGGVQVAVAHAQEGGRRHNVQHEAALPQSSGPGMYIMTSGAWPALAKYPTSSRSPCSSYSVSNIRKTTLFYGQSVQKAHIKYCN